MCISVYKLILELFEFSVGSSLRLNRALFGSRLLLELACARVVGGLVCECPGNNNKDTERGSIDNYLILEIIEFVLERLLALLGAGTSELFLLQRYDSIM